jgi:hypothetical protein
MRRLPPPRPSPLVRGLSDWRIRSAVSGSFASLHCSPGSAALHPALYSVAPLGCSGGFMFGSEGPNAERRRRAGLKPGVKRSETPGIDARIHAEPLTRGDGERGRSQVAVIERQSVRADDDLQFLQKRNGSMMFFLSLDVSPNLRNLRLAHGESAVAFLPRETATFSKRLRNPTRRIRLDLSNQFRQRLVLAQLRQNVDVIGGAVDDQPGSVFAANRTGDVFVDTGANRCPEPWLASLRRKDDVINEVAVGGTHRKPRFPSPPFGGSVVLTTIPGVPLRSTPGFNSVAPFGRSIDPHYISGVLLPYIPDFFSAPSFRRWRKVRCDSSAGGSVLLVKRPMYHRWSAARAASSDSQRRRRVGLKPRVQRSGTPGRWLPQNPQPLTRGDGTGASGCDHARSKQPK